MTGSPDDWMGADVGKLVMRTRERINRLCRISKLIEKEQDQTQKELIRNTLGENEIRMCKTIGIAVRARAKEVAEYMTKYLMLDNVTEEAIQENPWMMCCAAGYQWDRIRMLLEARDAANEIERNDQ